MIIKKWELVKTSTGFEVKAAVDKETAKMFIAKFEEFVNGEEEITTLELELWHEVPVDKKAN